MARDRSGYVAPVNVLEYGPLTIGYDASVLTPRRWTRCQATWAAHLLDELPPGPVLELCTGAGHIGLLAVHGTGRRLVAVDASPEACAWARRNAAVNGIEAEVREGLMGDVLHPDERFGLIIADPPWVPRNDCGRFPEDPVTAIDGGPDGLDIARECIRLIGRHLDPGGSALLQLGTEEQISDLHPCLGEVGLVADERMIAPGRGVVVRLPR